MRRDASPLAPLTAWGRVSGRLTRWGFWPCALGICVLQAAGMALASFWLLAVASLLIWPVLAAAVRRLHDTGRSGHWLWLLAVPYLGVVPIWLLTRRSAPDRTRFPSIDDTPWPRVAVAAIAVALIALRWSIVILPLPGAAMKPGILPGDVVLGLRAISSSAAACAPARCPWGAGARPAPGQIILFRHEGQAEARRVIGLPGDVVALQGGRVQRAGQDLAQRSDGLFVEPFRPSGPLRALPRCAGGAVGLNAPCPKRRLIETLPSGRSYRVLDAGLARFDTVAPIATPGDSVFVLGDNRDNAMDSRMPRAIGGLGPVPRDAVIGRAWLVLFSVDGPAWQLWKIRPDRVLVALQ